MYMCYRWILLLFKREFAFTEVLRLWEVRLAAGPVAIHWLRACQSWPPFGGAGPGSTTLQVVWSEHLTADFHLYIAAAMLHHARRAILTTANTSDDLFRIIHRLSGTLDLDAVRWAAEALFRRLHPEPPESIAPL